MNPFLELQLLLIQNPELQALQQKIDEDTKNMSPLAKCMYLQELMLDNCRNMKSMLDYVNERVK